ncbi:hypothetical protein Tco_0072534, partial [Tanacetum coccineum]
IKEQAILRTRSNSGRRPGLGLVLLEKTRSKEDIEEVFTISHERPDQYVTVGATLTTNCKQLLVDILQENMEVFAWTKPESTAVSRFVMEHQLKIYPLVEPVVHKRRPVAPKGRLALKERVFHWLGEGLIRKVRHPEWITNPIPIKLANRTWKLQIDYSSLNKACSKDMYPFTEEKEELASLMGYPYKCFLRLPKEYNQIRMAEDDEEKTGFHKEEGDDGKGLSRSKRMKRGNTLGGHCNKKQNKGGKVPWPHAISKFISKLAELKHPLRKARTRMETTKEAGWTNEVEEALRRIKRKLGKLQTLAIPKEGETLINHKVKVVTDGPIEEILKLSGKEGRLAKWAAEIRTYDISYILRKEAEGLVMKKFFGQGEQIEGTLDANEGGTFTLSKKLQVKSTSTPRA